jgi:hypothetical protein
MSFPCIPLSLTHWDMDTNKILTEYGIWNLKFEKQSDIDSHGKITFNYKTSDDTYLDIFMILFIDFPLTESDSDFDLHEETHKNGYSLLYEMKDKLQIAFKSLLRACLLKLECLPSLRDLKKHENLNKINQILPCLLKDFSSSENIEEKIFSFLTSI